MNTVSFGSTYKISDKTANFEKNKDVCEFCERNELEWCSKTEGKGGYFDVPDFRTNMTIIAPDAKDNMIEAYLANKGIKFKKLDTQELMKKSKILSRIEDAPKGKKLVEIDVKKLEELLPKQDTNIKYCESNYNDYYKDSVNSMLRSGDKITATTLYIAPTGESVDDTINYVKNFGADRLNTDQVSLYFEQKTDDPDHCVFFGLRDAGLDKVPVYVDNGTHKLGKALGLFK